MSAVVWRDEGAPHHGGANHDCGVNEEPRQAAAAELRRIIVSLLETSEVEPRTL